MTTKAIAEDSLNAILRLLTPQNRLVCLASIATGLRVSDVLLFKREQLTKDRFTIYESKTGKKKTVRLPNKLRDKMLGVSGALYVFPHRLNGRKPRTRQAVWKDLNRVARMLHIKGIAPHSMRKTYARTLRAEGLTEVQIQKALNHSSPIVTKLYSMADEVSLR